MASQLGNSESSTFNHVRSIGVLSSGFSAGESLLAGVSGQLASLSSLLLMILSTHLATFPLDSTVDEIESVFLATRCFFFKLGSFNALSRFPVLRAGFFSLSLAKVSSLVTNLSGIPKSTLPKLAIRLVAKVSISWISSGLIDRLDGDRGI
jgi:hypothetical protein